MIPHTTQNWHLHKPAARGGGGIVVSQVKTAAEAGAEMLRAGGSAADAAVATAFVLASLEPWNCGLGGIGFAQAMKPGMAVAETFDFGPVAPAGLDPAAYPLTGRAKQDLFPWPEVEGDRNIHGPLSCVIPSAVAGYALLHERHGRLPIHEVLAPAVALAKRGLPQDWYTTLKVAASASVLRLYPESARIYLPNGLPPVAPYQGKPGFFTQGNLPATLERLQRAGLRDLYEGEVAAQLVADMKTVGGIISAADLANCHARVLPAIAAPWRGRTLMLANGLTAAPTLKRVLAGMADAPFGDAPSAAWYAMLARAMQDAYAERLAGLGDAEPSGADSCTTHLTVCDKDGMMVAMTTTLLSSMGSRVVLPGTGILMNNGVMWFDPQPGTPNAMAPGKRPLTNMCPVIAATNGQPEIACGASGGRRIMAAVFQLLSFVADFGMDPDAAAHHPRIDVSGPSGIAADQRLAPEVLEALTAVGPLEVMEHGVLPLNFACPNLIQRGPDGAVGISDAMTPWSGAVAA
ncbi:gamma-glutamyltransferase [Siccirubricoccus deserti]|uniref:Gamma-glutamyltransferase n=1 Tax=Siccirubricoccus deserti TaxID=2013562 RepID=A0A9X0R5R0_9PROT|nr:gamma-glutamyltransferase [Siccirubricoccus deserti]MBC4018877.1 gamma-glutamyltransferase [Siccirubricoccus deserti]GGC69029.1 gamma-glutamyltransferase [Siccirubricoccus deserti]